MRVCTRTDRPTHARTWTISNYTRATISIFISPIISQRHAARAFRARRLNMHHHYAGKSARARARACNLFVCTVWGLRVWTHHENVRRSGAVVRHRHAELLCLRCGAVIVVHNIINIHAIYTRVRDIVRVSPVCEYIVRNDGGLHHQPQPVDNCSAGNHHMHTFVRCFSARTITARCFVYMAFDYKYDIISLFLRAF